MPTIDQANVSQLPATTPQLFLDGQLNQARETFTQQHQIVQSRLQQNQIDRASAERAIAGLQAEFDKTYNKISTLQTTMQQTQTLMDMGIFDPQQGNAALWEMVLPTEVAQRVLPRDTEGAPFSPAQLQGTGDSYGKGGFVPSISEFAGAAPATGLRWNSILPGDQGTRKHEDLETQYQAWREYIGYNALNPGKKRQVDSLWDDFMKGNVKYKAWNPDSKNVKALRATGPLQRAFVNRGEGTPTSVPKSASPLAQGVAAANKPKTVNGKVHMMGPNGQTGWVPQAEIGAAEQAGYKKIP